MNRTLLNQILTAAFHSCDAIEDSVDICLAEQEIPIDVRRFQNAITDEGDIRMQSIDASERLAHLINEFGEISDVEDCYSTVLEGIRQETSFSSLSLKSSSQSAVSTENERYVRLSRKIQQMKEQGTE